MELLGHGWRPNTGGPGNLSIRPIRFYYRIRELNFYIPGDLHDAVMIQYESKEPVAFTDSYTVVKQRRKPPI
jgi:hypothetical protein